jgi:hypothetical protein
MLGDLFGCMPRLTEVLRNESRIRERKLLNEIDEGLS